MNAAPSAAAFAPGIKSALEFALDSVWSCVRILF